MAREHKSFFFFLSILYVVLDPMHIRCASCDLNEFGQIEICASGFLPSSGPQHVQLTCHPKQNFAKIIPVVTYVF